MTPQKYKALITGAAGGMGKAIARRLLAEGFDVLITDIDAGALAATAAELGDDVDHLACDLGDASQRERLMVTAGPLYALVNNAGIFSTAEADALTGADFLRMYEINTVAAFELARLAAASMRGQGGGRIVNISSRSWLGAVKVAHYAASKGAMSTLTKCLALEWAADNILVNAVAPGVIETPILAGWDADERARLASYQPLGRIGRPEDIANVVAMLASPDTDYITGQVIVVDGGRSVGGGGHA
ncbi:SDR family NAD(P)-dependent oxidoreductase [Halomonas icarae]|uniref:SDR family oxidoreductase n=1 Tax=Halomonas icarae TaxID=2691040 RepID=A0A7X4W0E9_9GAMM|nr:SDR family NAD(P)-dependent oxidoreductase [Halomonas icarae]MDR5902995.1 SDR family NAD(P)-dependent oxidoreductase [Halomonas icarae]NAW13570.1 SDR family oxidoreductase [Halomonas icarae]